ALELLLTRIGDRPDADRVHGSGHALARIELGVELGEARPVGAALKRILARLERPALEAREPLQHILRPADRLAELAVADDVDPGIGLRLDYVDDRLGEALVIGLLVEAVTLLPGAQELLQLRRPDQAADMGGEDALGTAFHAEGQRLRCALVTAGLGGNNPW